MMAQRLARRFWDELWALLRALLRWDGWLTAIVLMAMLFPVVWSVEKADWVRTPGLGNVLFFGVLTGILLARLSISAWALHLLGLMVGAVTVVWQVLPLLREVDPAARLEAFAERMGLWFGEALHGGISTDDLPFALALTALAWLMGYGCGWAMFRWRNVWVVVLVSGMGIITNLAYLPERTYSDFFLYLVFAMFLIARVSALRRGASWVRRRVTFPGSLGLYALNDAFWFSLLVIIVAFLLPVHRADSPLMRRAWEELRWPVEVVRDDFNRLFAAVPARKPVPFHAFDDTLPFRGTISLGEQVVLVVESPYPLYMRARAYPVYTSKGWVVGRTRIHDIGWRPTSGTPEPMELATSVAQQVTVNFGTGILFASGYPEDVSLLARIETPEPTTYQVVIGRRFSAGSLPPEVESLAESLRRARLARRGALTEGEVRALMPPDLELTGTLQDANSRIVGVVVAYRQPDPPDVISLVPARRLGLSDTYRLTSRVSAATEEELRQTTTEYPGWVRSTYLALPDTLPNRVRRLALDLTAGADNPYDKAVAIQEYLRTFQYTQSIPAPPFDADGVDYFLFELRRGYSDYFGSAMAVLLRAAGVPARMAAGYAPGEPLENGTFVVRDRDSHGWTEVYFPGYGWVPFEPTPSRPLISRERVEAEPPVALATGGRGRPVEEEEELVPPFAGGGQRRLTPWWHRALWGAGAASGLATLSLLAMYLWRCTLAVPADAGLAFPRLAWLGTLAGVDAQAHQTPFEYSRALSARFPDLREAISPVVDAYVRRRYARMKAPDSEETEVVSRAWRLLRRRLLARIVRRR